MGSPLRPLFANIRMSFIEKSWLHDCPESFIDVVLMSVLIVRPCTPFPRLLMLPFNISFASELEKDQNFPFLDIEITRSNGTPTDFYIASFPLLTNIL